MASSEDKWVNLGRISGLFGVRGWVKIYSYTDPRDNILHYDPWYLKIDGQWQPHKLLEGQAHGKGVVAHLEGILDRDQATRYIGTDIAVTRDSMPAAQEGEYYWMDLIGLTVITINGVELGQVDHLMETGANDVLVVKGDKERLIPYIPEQVIREIDLAASRIIVDWDPDF